LNPIAVARRQTAAPDGVLVQEAAAGGGSSYAALYDRYADQVYNYSLRLTGSPEDAADATQGAFVNVLARLQHDDRPVLDFASYLFTAARNESYALMRRRSRAQPTEDVPERAASVPDLETDPERAALLRDSQESVRLANAKLAPRHREVLALREVAGRSYEEIGQIMGVSENAAAQLIWRARAKLKEALTAGAVASVVATSEDCETAQLLINRLQDGESITDAEQTWLDEHLDECGKCRAARGMLFEVGTSYRAWAPVAVLAALRPEVLTQAGAVVGADWSGIAGNGAGGATAGGGGGGAGGGGNGASGGTRVPRPRGHQAAAQGVAGVAVIAAAGFAISGLLHDGSPVTRDAGPAEQSPPASTAKSSSSPSASKADAKAKAASVLGVARAASGGVAGAIQPAAAGPQGPAGLSPPGAAPRDPFRGGSPNISPQPRNGPPGGKSPGPGSPKKPAPKGSPPTGNPPPGSPPGPPAGTPTNPAPNTPPAGPPPTVTPPAQPPPTGGPCTFPGHGNGPGGCPPGHGGTPPGHGGTPPGQGGDGPGHGRPH
jgi:RNA polymerase sigma factor (sigma-70 family)